MRIESVEREKARRGGYFWMSCPLCREMHGGHETYGSLMLSVGSGICTCKGCAEEANRRNKAFYQVLGAEIRDEHQFVKFENEDDHRLAFLKDCVHGPADWAHICYYCGKPWDKCLDDIKERSDRILELASEMGVPA